MQFLIVFSSQTQDSKLLLRRQSTYSLSNINMTSQGVQWCREKDKVEYFRSQETLLMVETKLSCRGQCF